MIDFEVQKEGERVQASPRKSRVNNLSTKEVVMAWVELTKPRITFLLTFIALLTYFGAVSMGFALNNSITLIDIAKILWVVISLSFGIFPLNHYLERNRDSLMMRTEKRPIPSGAVKASHALVFGLASLLVSLTVTAFIADARMVALSSFVAISYVLIYTPLKYKTAWHTTLGAFPGAAPPLIGWLIATGNLDLGAWILFGILFFWQFPHFMSIDMIYKEDYAKASVKILPLVDKSGIWTTIQVLTALVALVASSLMPVLWLKKGLVYGIVALILGLGFTYIGAQAVLTKKKMHAKYLLRASVIYLPLIFLALILCP